MSRPLGRQAAGLATDCLVLPLSKQGLEITQQMCHWVCGTVPSMKTTLRNASETQGLRAQAEHVQKLESQLFQETIQLHGWESLNPMHWLCGFLPQIFFQPLTIATTSDQFQVPAGADYDGPCTL